MMGLFGIIIASIVNMFMKSAMMYYVISILGVLIFVGLTAYDTQKIKNMYLASDTGEIMGKKAVMGALTLYLDFINLFINGSFVVLPMYIVVFSVGGACEALFQRRLEPPSNHNLGHGRSRRH